MKRKLVCRQAHEHVAHCFKGLKGKCDCPVCVNPKAPPPHTPGPLKTEEREPGEINLVDQEGRDIALVMEWDGISYEEALQNVRRLAACWNTCAGISTEALEGAKVAEILGAAQDHLEAAPCQNNCPKGDKDCTANSLRAILAKFEGKP